MNCCIRDTRAKALRQQIARDTSQIRYWTRARDEAVHMLAYWTEQIAAMQAALAELEMDEGGLGQ